MASGRLVASRRVCVLCALAAGTLLVFADAREHVAVAEAVRHGVGGRVVLRVALHLRAHVGQHRRLRVADRQRVVRGRRAEIVDELTDWCLHSTAQNKTNGSEAKHNIESSQCGSGEESVREWRGEVDSRAHSYRIFVPSDRRMCYYPADYCSRSVNKVSER